MTLVIKVIRLLLVEVEVTDDEALVPSSATVPAKADWYPAKTSPPAAAVPPATARARRRMRGVSWWFPVMDMNVGTPPVSGMGER